MKRRSRSVIERLAPPQPVFERYQSRATRNSHSGTRRHTPSPADSIRGLGSAQLAAPLQGPLRLLPADDDARSRASDIPEGFPAQWSTRAMRTPRPHPQGVCCVEVGAPLDPESSGHGACSRVCRARRARSPPQSITMISNTRDQRPLCILSPVTAAVECRSQVVADAVESATGFTIARTRNANYKETSGGYKETSGGGLASSVVRC